MTTKNIKLSDVLFDQSIYPRKRHDPALVQRYAECMDAIETAGNYIAVANDGRIVDGRHRHLAYLTIYKNEPAHEITVTVYDASDDEEVFRLAAELNSQAGWQMTDDDKRSAAVRMYSRGARLTQEVIARSLSVSKVKVSQWLTAILDDEKKAREETILSMWLECNTQEQIADAVGMSRASIVEYLSKMSEKYNRNDSDNFSNFEPELYSVWNFGKATNEVKHFGNIPPEIVDNLLYYYTNPFDVVFDPFAGGGSTIDMCRKRMRRYYASDLNPIPARPEIRKHDITTGLPDGMPVPSLVFLDPPYWRQAEGKYSNDATDLANIELEAFLESIGNIARDMKRKWKDSNGGTLALIIGADQHDGEFTDLPLLCYERITKYLTEKQNIVVPYATQVYGGAHVNRAKETKSIMNLHRLLTVWGK